MKQLQYQLKAVDELVDKTIALLGNSKSRQTYIFQSPTGSGKTVMLMEMLMRLNRELTERPDAPCPEVAFIWIAPNKLHEQSYQKMKRFFADNCALHPVLYDELDHSTDGYIKPGEILFINWESVNKDKNHIVKETENSSSIYDIVRRTQEDNGIPIIIIIDEEHKMASSSAKKAENVLKNISAKIELRVSATPDMSRGHDDYTYVKRDHVIDEEMIKKKIILNPALDFKNPRGSLNQHLIWLALQKREELANAYNVAHEKGESAGVNPLLLIQLPNDSESTTAEDRKVREEIIETLDTYGINTTNGKLAIWLSGEKTDNLDTLDRPDDPTEVLLFKQAIALGWDCPRAAVLLIFRKIESFEFTAQVVGRILRMPEQKHYEDDRLNYGYVFTNLSKEIITIYNDDIDYFKNNLSAIRRKDITNIVLDSEYEKRLSVDRNRLGADFKDVLIRAFISEWNLSGERAGGISAAILFGDKELPAPVPAEVKNTGYENRLKAMAMMDIRFDVQNITTDVAKDLEMTGEIGENLVRSKAVYVNNADDLTAMYLAFCKQLLGNEYEQVSVRTLGGTLKEVMRELFELSDYDTMKVVLYDEAPHRNRSRFGHLLAIAIRNYSEILQCRKAEARRRAYEHCTWQLPDVRYYSTDTYDEQPDIKDHALLPFMENRGAKTPEKSFKDFLEKNSHAIEWWYKNGDSGRAHYAISYTKASGERGLFYVDFIIRMKTGEIFLFDTKEGEIDKDVVEKHNALVDYIHQPENQAKNISGGGIIQQDDFGNWVYPPDKLTSSSELNNTVGWPIFIPGKNT